MADPSSYLLADGAAELERLRLQARVWESQAAMLFDQIGIQPGWSCIDLGCGAMGVLGPSASVSARTGASSA